MISLRTHLTLGRVSNLPTVWSNVLCAWIIVGGYSYLQLASYLIGASLLYVGGMYLNDFCDREFDREYCPQRPIPSGKAEPAAVLKFASALLALGILAFAWSGLLPAAFAAGLALAIVLYDVNHKGNPIAPIFMAACRALLYFAIASAFENGIDTNTLIAAGTLFTFVLGVTYLARSESTTNAIDYPALAIASLPLLGAFYYRSEAFDTQRAAVLALFVGWAGLAFFRARSEGGLIIGKTIGPLLASLPLLDLLILSTIGFATQNHLFLFAALFALTTTAQRAIPPT